MIERQADRMLVRSAILMDNAPAVLAEGLECLQGGAAVFDLSAVTQADSSAIAVMLGWLRAAEAARSTLRFVGIPAGVLSLARMYGVADLLPQG